MLPYLIFIIIIPFIIEIKAQSSECQTQRQKMFQCLTMLHSKKFQKEMDVIKNALSLDDEAQPWWISQWEAAVKAMEKCRGYDPDYDKCAPKSEPLPDMTNRTSYLIDKIDCIQNASQQSDVLEMKESFGRQIELQCFGTSAPPAERHCHPNGRVKRCLIREMKSSYSTVNLLLETFNATTTKTQENKNETSTPDGATENPLDEFYRLYDSPKKEHWTSWKCYECLYIATEECRPSTKQRECILTQKKPILKLYKKHLKNCMESKGYRDILYNTFDEFELLAKVNEPSKSDVCYAVSEDVYIR